MSQDAFGPFMRVEQLIISTAPSDGSGAAVPIVSDSNIKLLFDMQDAVDKLSVPVAVSAGRCGVPVCRCY